jgi:hypothetical protein
MPDTPVLMAWPLSNTGLKFPQDSPPSPEDLIQDPLLMQHVFTPQSERESGIDVLVFMHRRVGSDAVTASDLIAIGIQCKWSDDAATTKLDTATVKKAQRNFHSRMKKWGWQPEQLVLVVPAYLDVSCNANLLQNVSGNVAVLGKGCGIEEWLGPSLLETARCIHAAHISSGPYASWPEEEQT